MAPWWFPGPWTCPGAPGAVFLAAARPTARALTDADVLRRLDALLADADPEAAAVLDRLGDADAAELLHRLADPDPAEVAALARLADLDADPEAAAVLDRLARAYRPVQAAPENRPPRPFS